jgi:hypothetical protein
VSSFPVTYKTKPSRALLSEIFWSAGVLFAISLAFIVSGAVILLTMCLFRLADLSHEWKGDIIGQFLLQRERMADTRHRELWSDRDNVMLPPTNTFVLSSVSSSSK